MANSTNKEWVIPSNIPDQIQDIKWHWTDDVFDDVLDAIDNANTLTECQSAVDSIFETEIFLRKL